MDILSQYMSRLVFGNIRNDLRAGLAELDFSCNIEDIDFGVGDLWKKSP